MFETKLAAIPCLFIFMAYTDLKYHSSCSFKGRSSVTFMPYDVTPKLYSFHVFEFSFTHKEMVKNFTIVILGILQYEKHLFRPNIYIYNRVFLAYTSNCHFSHALMLTEKKRCDVEIYISAKIY